MLRSRSLGERPPALCDGEAAAVELWTGGTGCQTPTSVPLPKAWMALPAGHGEEVSPPAVPPKLEPVLLIILLKLSDKQIVLLDRINKNIKLISSQPYGASYIFNNL